MKHLSYGEYFGSHVGVIVFHLITNIAALQLIATSDSEKRTPRFVGLVLLFLANIIVSALSFIPLTKHDTFIINAPGSTLS